MLRTTIKIGSTALAAVLIAVPIASGKSHPRTPSIGQGYSLGVPVQHLNKQPSSGSSLGQCPCNLGLPDGRSLSGSVANSTPATVQPRGATASGATAPDIRQTDPRASGPFTTDTLGGNGGGIIAAPAESQTDGGLLSAAMKSHAAQVSEPRTPGYRFITDTLGGNGVQPASPQGVLDAVKRSSPNQVGLAWQYLRDTGQIATPTPSTPSRPDDRAGARGVDNGATAIASSPTRFDWSDAGAGAAGAAGLMMLLGVAALTQRRSRRRTRMAA